LREFIAAVEDRARHDDELTLEKQQWIEWARAEAPSRFFRTMHTLHVPHRKPRCPPLLVHPGADNWTPTDISRDAFDRVLGDKHLRELSNGSHLPVELPARLELEEEVTQFLKAVELDDLAGAR
jgi:pimeloyl-ACP methyl ester carboxylesterase